MTFTREIVSYASSLSHARCLSCPHALDISLFFPSSLSLLQSLAPSLTHRRIAIGNKGHTLQHAAQHLQCTEHHCNTLQHPKYFLLLQGAVE